MVMVTCGQARSHELVRAAGPFNDAYFFLPSASADETIQRHAYPPPTQPGLKPMTPITCTTGFRAVLPVYLHAELDSDAFPYLLAGSGDRIRVYDISSLDEVELIREVEGHWHDVTHLRTWIQGSVDGTRRDAWIVSGSLDGTLRRWKLSGALGVTVLWQPCPHQVFQSLSFLHTLKNLPP